MEPVHDQPGIGELFFSFFRLGITCFGGPAMVAYIKDMVVSRKHWMAEDAMDDGIALSQSLPGVIAMDTAAYVGFRLRGIRGALAAYVGFTLPAFLLMWGLSAAYVASRSVPRIVSLMTGLQVLVVAIVANATLSFLKKTANNWRSLLLAALCGALLILDVSPFAVIFGAALAGVLLFRNGAGPAPPREASDHPPSIVWKVAMLAVLPLVGLAFLYAADRPLFSLAVLMIQVNLFSFGGGYTALPLMLHQVVTVHGWMDQRTLMDGIALGQVTPGPISITATFIGYVLYRVRGALVATLAIYTPCFLLMLLSIPYYDMLKRSRAFARAMRGIAASFIGLLLFATYTFASAITWGPLKLVIAMAAFTALVRKIDILWVVAAGAVVSLIVF